MSTSYSDQVRIIEDDGSETIAWLHCDEAKQDIITMYDNGQSTSYRFVGPDSRGRRTFAAKAIKSIEVGLGSES